MSRITVLGMGAMGARMAQNLLKQGHAVTVWNRSVEKTVALVSAGAEAADTPRAAVESAEFVISMVRDDEASRQVWLKDEVGALDGLSKNAIAIESSTLTVDWTRTLAQHFEKKACVFLDAPVAGSLPQAEGAQLIYFIGGEKESIERVRPILDTLGKYCSSRWCDWKWDGYQACSQRAIWYSSSSVGRTHRIHAALWIRKCAGRRYIDGDARM